MIHNNYLVFQNLEILTSLNLFYKIRIISTPWNIYHHLWLFTRLSCGRVKIENDLSIDIDLNNEQASIDDFR
jgi:hypothetical protein